MDRGFNYGGSPRIARIAVGLILLAAALLKMHAQMLTAKPSPQTTLDMAGFQVLAALAEFALGSGLILGLWPAMMTRISIALFTTFACVSLIKAIGGTKSCGCFGALRISPWYTAMLDMSAFAALIVFKPTRLTATAVPPRHISRRAFGTLVLLACIVTAAVGIVRRSAALAPRSEARNGRDAFGQPGSPVVLEPSSWLRKVFLLGTHIETGAKLGEGRWIVLLVHHDCGDCTVAVSKYAALAGRVSGTRLAIVEMPPYAEAGEGFPPSSAVSLNSRLDNTRDWFAMTPVAVLLHNGVVQAVADGEHAAMPDPTWWLK